MLKAITFPVVDGRSFELTINGEPVFVPVEPVREFVEGCCPWMDGITGFASACERCKIGFG